MKLLQIEEEDKKMEGVESTLGMTEEKEKISPEKASPMKPLAREMSCNSLLSQIRAAGKKSDEKIDDDKPENTYLNHDLDYGILVNHTPLKVDKTDKTIVIKPSE